jgi:hypothetical protein
MVDQTLSEAYCTEKMQNGPAWLQPLPWSVFSKQSPHSTKNTGEKNCFCQTCLWYTPVHAAPAFRRSNKAACYVYMSNLFFFFSFFFKVQNSGYKFGFSDDLRVATVCLIWTMVLCLISIHHSSLLAVIQLREHRYLPYEHQELKPYISIRDAPIHSSSTKNAMRS